MTEEEKQRGLELQAYADSLRGMTLKKIAIKHLKKYHLPKFFAGLLVKFSYPLLLAKDYQLSELEKDKQYFSDSLDKQIEATLKLQQKNEKLEQKNIEDINTLNKCVEYWKTKSELLEDQLTKAKEIIKKFSEFANLEVEYDPEHPQEHTDLWNELCKEAEQFLKDSEVEK